MKPLAPPIGLAELPAGILVSLPRRFWLVVSLRKSFRGVIAGPEPWTYLVPKRRTARLGEWIAEVELQILAERRRRVWTADEAEWSGAAEVAVAAAPAAAPALVRLPRTRTARPTLDLLQRMAAGEVLTAESGRYRLLPSGRAIRPSVASRAIGDRLIVPSCDGLFGPEWSQTWRSPTQEELRAAENASGDCRPSRRQGRADDRRSKAGGTDESGPARAARLPRASQGVGDTGRRAGARRGGVGVAAAKPARRAKRSAGA